MVLGPGKILKFQPVQTATGQCVQADSFPGSKAAGVAKLTPYLHLVPRYRSGGLSPYAPYGMVHTDTIPFTMGIKRLQVRY
jgi:hypothetical protein